MARYPLGQPVRISTVVRDLSGALATPSALTLTVSKPDATTQAYASPSLDSTGNYHQDVPATDLTQIGHYQFTWTSTGAGAGVVPGEFDVYDPFEVRVLSLQDAKDMLNIPQATTTSDAEIDAMIATVETSLEGMTGGPLVNRTVTERAELDGTYCALLVRQRPLVSVQSIVAVNTGTAVNISSGLDLDTNAGIIRTKLGWPFYGPFFLFSPIVNVTYTAGWGTVMPAAFSMAGRIIVQHLWQTQHGPSARPGMGGMETVTLPGWGFAIPNRAAELLDGSLNGMKFAQEAYV